MLVVGLRVEVFVETRLDLVLFFLFFASDVSAVEDGFDLVACVVAHSRATDVEVLVSVQH